MEQFLKAGKPFRASKAVGKGKASASSKDPDDMSDGEAQPYTANVADNSNKRRKKQPQGPLSVLREATLAIGNLGLETKRDSRLYQKGLMRCWKVPLVNYFDKAIEVFLGTPLDDLPTQRTWAQFSIDSSLLPSKPETAQAIKVMKAHVAQDPALWQEKVHFCLVKRTYDQKHIRVCLWIDLQKELQAVNTLLLDLGAVAQWEPPPRSARERIAANAITKLAKFKF